MSVRHRTAKKAKKSLAVGLVAFGALLGAVGLGAYAYSKLSPKHHAPNASRIAARRNGRKNLALQHAYAALHRPRPVTPAQAAAAKRAYAAALYAAAVAANPPLHVALAVVPGGAGTSQLSASAAPRAASSQAPRAGRHGARARGRRHARHRLGV